MPGGACAQRRPVAAAILTGSPGDATVAGSLSCPQWAYSHAKAHISTQQHQAQARSRLPCAHEDSLRSRHPACPSRQGPQAPRGLIVAAAGMPDASFPRSARLLDATDFAALRTGSQRIPGRHFHATLALRDRPGARLGMAVSRRVSLRATQRNRIKRLIRESFRTARTALPGADILIIARPGAAAVDNAALSAELARLWRRVAALKRGPANGTMTG